MKIVNKYNPYGSAHNRPAKIIVHAMGEYVLNELGEYIHAPDYLMSEGLSAHAMVAPDGTIYRCRHDDEGAYHARGFNAASLGIEILVAGEHDYNSFARVIKTPYVTDSQYQALVDQCKEWVKLYGITDVKRHSDVSPGRKIDPGAGFPWSKFLKDIS